MYRSSATTSLTSHRATPQASPVGSPYASVVVRPGNAADADALRRLALLDSRRPIAGDTLVAEGDGRLLAAVPLAGGPAIADPFRLTADLVGLLELRATQLRLERGAGERAGPRSLGRASLAVAGVRR